MEAKEFYDKFKSNMNEINHATGVCRKSLARLPSENIRKDTAEVVLDYLEWKSIKEYQETIKKCRGDIVAALLKIKEAWENYLARDKLISLYRKKYGISSKETLVRRVKASEVLKEVLKEI